MKIKALIITISTILFGLSSLNAQHRIEGRIADAETGEPLPAAHIVIKDTYKGTISNQDGEFSLIVSELPVTLIARFIGFESQEVVVTNADKPVDFLLHPSIADMGEITVSGEDPAIAIMREVIERKKIWRADLRTYQAEAYTRQQLKNDTSIISISESVSIAYWDKEKGSREILKSKRQTANMDEASNFAGVSYLPNFYDDNLDIAGFNVVGVTHPDALSYYDFTLEDMQSIDGQVVYEISVGSRRQFQPLFEGTIFVLGEEYALLEVDLKPNAVVVFPPPVQDFDLSYSQQFSNFGGEFWLPVDVRIDGLVEIGVVGLRFPPVGFRQVAKLNDYKVNIELPDTLFQKNEMLSVDSASVAMEDSIFFRQVDVIPLDEQEEVAYKSIDSTATLEKALRPTGFFTRFIDWEEESGSDGTTVSASTGGGGQSGGSQSSVLSKLTRNITPQAHFNRVEALYAGLKHERRYIDNRLRSTVFGGYSTGYGSGEEAFSFGVKMSLWPLKNTRRFALVSEYKVFNDTQYNSDMFTPTLTSFTPLFGYPDYFDYYRNESFSFGGAYLMRTIPGAIRLTYNYETHESIDYSTNYDLIGRNNIQRPNSYVDEGNLGALTLTWNEGNDKKAFGAVGAEDFELSVEHSASYLSSSWDYTKFKIDLYRSIETFYQRRFFPNTLEMRLNAGTYIGDLPVQKNEVLDVAQGVFTPFGAFKTKRYVPYEGASYVALNAEHNFKSVPLEMLGWRNAPQTGLSVIAFGGIGKTWVRDRQVDEFQNRYGFSPSFTEDLHMEAGISLSNIFSLFRADLAYRIDQPGFFLGISVARFF
ncbi:DUF5686 and carboxypeptidase-like regulatory domain-containing protein [Gracilimonas amylolytica]|uniref:DUF5686 and carboxypeptidase-like regulatory domain-containing protein n=1 Tax=Gracilimonas amylolytica TaxID=1749045 RepID=UPI000CD9A378|nr:DUF5686 and carboxypeptidase-like regulatory domain-containing protein [Gracilimonas amylolytica]